ncbi:MAG: aminotransferase class III-fold pyridoxal phosphate-dependent enzyme [Saprospiraceae bacterium]
MNIIQIKEILALHYSLTGDLEMIYSELDAVYSLSTISNQKFVIKISNPSRSRDILELESRIIEHFRNSSFPYQLQEIIRTVEGEEMVNIDQFHIRVLAWIDAKLLAECNPSSTVTRDSIGQMLGLVSLNLKQFNHQAAHRSIKWDPSGLPWIKDYIDLLPTEWQLRFNEQLDKFERLCLPILDQCPKQINYNDANDYNILCHWNDAEQVFVSVGLIDWLDVVYTHRINELAIACAYCILKLPDPLTAAAELVSGYHRVNPLEDAELKVLPHMILSRLMISVTVSSINKAQHPENNYLQVTETDAWNLIEKWMSIHEHLAYYTFRSVCGKVPVPDSLRFVEWTGGKSFSSIVPEKILKQPKRIDLSVGSEELGHFSNFTDERLLNKNVEKLFSESEYSVIIGSYNEIRPIYTTDSFKKEKNDGPSWRTVHIGQDFFAPFGTEIYAPCAGKIISLKNNIGSRDYGPTIIMQHKDQDLEWYSLYGHLSETSFDLIKEGDSIAQGQQIGFIGNQSENGGWPPHVHFQIILDLLNYTGDFPGVADFKDLNVWLNLCPDPFLITGIKSIPAEIQTVDELIHRRKKLLGNNLSLSYKKPLWIKRGIYQYLIDHTGRLYLDTVNNVAHCGHEHPRIVSAGTKSMSILNTNTRYLHENILELAENLLRKTNNHFSVCYFTNSGTEANELAIRMAKNFTGSKDILTMQWGYHGNSNMMVDLSSYKFDRKGGTGKPHHTHVIPMADPLRGKYAGQPDQSTLYLQEIQKILDNIATQDSKPAALFAESIISCGGQIVYPSAFFSNAVDKIRNAGGIYIADEVQTGLGRTGEYFSAYEMYGVMPDIMTLGKPLGNGHPIGAVLCTSRIAASFNNGMEYFNTFGGNPVSCAIATEVLQVIDDEKLMENALLIGNYLIKELNLFKKEFKIIADVRGHGFFLGIELLKNERPAGKEANYLTSRMREHGILMSTDGPDDNVIKIKPPMCFDMNNAEEVLDRMRTILKEHPFQDGI